MVEVIINFIIYVSELHEIPNKITHFDILRYNLMSTYQILYRFRYTQIIGGAVQR